MYSICRSYAKTCIADNIIELKNVIKKTLIKIEKW